MNHHSVPGSGRAREAAPDRGGSFDTIFGKLTLRATDNQMIMPNYFGYIGEQGGKLRPIISYTVPSEQATPAPIGTCKMGTL